MYQKCHIKIIPIQIIHILKDRTSEYLLKYVLQEKQLLFITILWSEAVLFMPKEQDVNMTVCIIPYQDTCLNKRGAEAQCVTGWTVWDVTMVVTVPPCCTTTPCWWPVYTGGPWR